MDNDLTTMSNVELLDWLVTQGIELRRNMNDMELRLAIRADIRKIKNELLNRLNDH